jgi:predicted ribosome quality control (RQC) complex YloA/Tae2 family protein
LVSALLDYQINIILVNSKNKIIDSDKHIDSDISRFREIMPARPYILPPAQDKRTVEEIKTDSLIAGMISSKSAVEKYLLENIKGFSPLLCREICHRAGIDNRKSADSLNSSESSVLKTVLNVIFKSIFTSDFHPSIVYEDDNMNRPIDFHCLDMTQFKYSRKIRERPMRILG